LAVHPSGKGVAHSDEVTVYTLSPAITETRKSPVEAALTPVTTPSQPLYAV